MSDHSLRGNIWYEEQLSTLRSLKTEIHQRLEKYKELEKEVTDTYILQEDITTQNILALIHVKEEEVLKELIELTSEAHEKLHTRYSEQRTIFNAKQVAYERAEEAINNAIKKLEQEDS